MVDQLVFFNKLAFNKRIGNRKFSQALIRREYKVSRLFKRLERQYYGASRKRQIVADSCRQFLTILNSCSYMTRRLYKTLSGATLLLFSFLQLQILVYRQSNRTGLRDPLAVLVPQLTKSLIVKSVVFFLAVYQFPREKYLENNITIIIT